MIAVDVASICSNAVVVAPGRQAERAGPAPETAGFPRSDAEISRIAA